ncbi:MAG: ATPase domain-containing protein [Thermoplasmata archaeon]
MAGDHQGEPAKKTRSSKVTVDRSMSRSSESDTNEITQLTSVDEKTGQSLIEEGYTDLEDIAAVDIEKITKETGLEKETIEEIKVEIREREEKEESDEVEQSEEDELSDWLTGESDDDIRSVMSEKGDHPQGKQSPTNSDERSTESLKAWLSGEKDSFTAWLDEESFEEEKEEIEEELEEKEKRLEKKEKKLEEKEKEIEELREKLEDRLGDFESEEFEPGEIVEENARLEQKIENKNEHIEEIKEEREKLEEEIEDIKRGSVAIAKYLKSQQSIRPQDGGAQVSDEELESLREENERLKERIDELETMSSSDVQVQQKVEGKNKEIRELKKELTHKEEKIEDLKEQVKHKEKELNEREEDLRHREQILRKERKELEAQKKEMENKTEKERKRELEELKQKIEKKEQELKAKQKYIDQKEKELRAKEEDLIDEELEEREEEILREIEQEKCKTGTGRLDDLLLGGIPLGSNVSIYGPPHVGKEVMVNSFIGEGLEKGVPAIWVITDKTIEDVREEMKFVVPTYEEYEMRSLVYYVDAYSVSMGKVREEEKEKDHVKYIEDQSDLKAITEAVNRFAEEIKENHRYYRMAFESVSTIIAYLDPQTTFRILQPFTGKRTRDNAVSLYTLEKGMHGDQEISMLGHIMNGEVKFKIDQLKNYLKVEGLGDVQTRDWIEYNHSKSGISMGSFSLDTIR